MFSIDAITFDFWDTIMVARVKDAHRTRVAACSAVFAHRGHEVDGEALDAALRAGFRAYQEAWRANRQFVPVDVATVCLDRLGLSGTEKLRDPLVAAIVSDGADRKLEPSPNIGSTLRGLRRAGLRIGIICDVGITGSRYLLRALQQAGLLGYFHHWSFSDEVGCYKPAPQIFGHAMAGLGVRDPARLCHVGDLRRTDVAGGRTAGWRTVRYAGLVDDSGEGPEADVVIRDHTELLDLVGCR